ncbi:hypothetical protein [Siminovitchia acidinfaciens]|uniref:hypothetical protein n=1 Tax=Siminovitchia acidinfaciens TaxID=2321395 RepID=UPI0013DFC509|nr:hypothetical protein [Siminovitchia acidinfaciens]
MDRQKLKGILNRYENLILTPPKPEDDIQYPGRSSSLESRLDQWRRALKATKKF